MPNGRIVSMYPIYALWSTLGHALPDGTPADNLAYNGGLVQTQPKVYLVFWGSEWNAKSGDPNGVQPLLNSFVRAIGGKGWLNTATQYYEIVNGTQHSVGNPGKLLAGAWVDPSAPPRSVSDAQVQAEADRAARRFGDTSSSANYIVALPHGVTTPGFGSQFCAYHRSRDRLLYQPAVPAGCGRLVRRRQREHPGDGRRGNHRCRARAS